MSGNSGVTPVAQPTYAPSVSTDPWIAFGGAVTATRPIGHSLVRVTVGGEAFRHFADGGYDQRVKLILPASDGEFRFPEGPNWYEQWGNQPEELQNPLRTYTVRAVRQELGEVDIDMVLHGDGGPASAWAQNVQIGDPVMIFGPNARAGGEFGGVEFVTPEPGTVVLLAGDETAQPAIATILEQLPADTRGKAILEMPHQDDVIDLTKPEGVQLEWLIRGDRPVGEPMLECFRDHAAELFADQADAAESEHHDPKSAFGLDNPDEMLWVVPGSQATSGVYSWIAGEAAMVRSMRRLLVKDLGVDKSSVAFMGYWRL